jgi:transcriptional regulator with PAS, ATPase and Fis domain
MHGADETPLLETVRQEGGEKCHVLIGAGNALPTPVPERIGVCAFVDTVEIGRGSASSACQRFETGDPHMSRQHVRLQRRSSDCVVLTDLGSRNGTFVDGEQVAGEVVLNDGSVVFAGTHVFVYRCMAPDELASIQSRDHQSLGPVPSFSPRMTRLFSRLRPLASSCVEILLTGETGVGKEVLAEAIHRQSGRRGAFVAINCAALPEGLVESELFGYVRGAHSTAVLKKAGLIEKAQGGTLYLDEIGEMSSSAQAKLLRFLQDGQYHALGATRANQADVRVVAATRAQVALDEDGYGLRSDLAARLGPAAIVIPPLRERLEDIGILVHHFLGGQPLPFDLQAYRQLFLNRWGGNIRELEKTVRMAAVLSTGPGSIGLEAISSPALRRRLPATRGDEARAAGQNIGARPSPPELCALLERHRGNVGKVAREIGRQRTLVWRWVRMAGLEPATYRQDVD